MQFIKPSIVLVGLLAWAFSVTHAQINVVQASPAFVTKDTLFKAPYVDVDEWRDKPVRHRYVHGGFKGTDTRFSFYFPPKEAYRGRFFQYITPVPDNENLSQGAVGEEDKIGFSISSGAYFVETNGGGRAALPGLGSDATLGAYRANAAVAQFSRQVAVQVLGGIRPYGYAFGGSGGAYRTIGGIESTEDVWDGVVPFVVGSPMAIPNVFTVRMHAMRVLQAKFPQIIDALEPGGSGNMYAGLTTEEKEALQEVTRMGFPPQSWFSYKTMGVHAFTAIYPGMSMADAKYFDDFWKVPGYLGANPPVSLLKARIQQTSTIKTSISEKQAIKAGLIQGPRPGEARGSADLAWKALGGREGDMPVAFQLNDRIPDVQFLGGDLLIKTGAAAGKKLLITRITEDKLLLGSADPTVLAAIKTGDEVVVDNSSFLAAQTYHRHQVPGSKAEYPVFDQFRNGEGKPDYPQRPMLLGPLFTRGAAGVLPVGKFTGKMILLESLWDREAFPWQADWYYSKVRAVLGDQTDHHFRVWFTDRALHGDFAKQEDPTRTVSYLGVLQQALRDLSAWVEKGIAPPPSTNYRVEEGQVVVPPTALERQGIQPLITVKANGGGRADVQTGQTVTFTAVAEVPPHTGRIVSAEWDFDGAGTFLSTGKFTPSDRSGSRATLKSTHSFTKPGTYFPTLRVASQRQGDFQTPYARIQNLGRVRVVVN